MNKIIPICLLILIMFSIFFNLSLLNKLENSIEIRNKLIDYLAEELEFSYYLFDADGDFEIKYEYE